MNKLDVRISRKEDFDLGNWGEEVTTQMRTVLNHCASISYFKKDSIVAIVSATIPRSTPSFGFAFVDEDEAQDVKIELVKEARESLRVYGVMRGVDKIHMFIRTGDEKKRRWAELLGFEKSIVSEQSNTAPIGEELYTLIYKKGE